MKKIKMKKRILSALAAGAMAITSIAGAVPFMSVNANDAAGTTADYSDTNTYNGELSYISVDENKDGTYDYVKIISCDESAVSVVVPEKIDGLPVRAIGTAFAQHESLKSVTIPEGVTSIVDNAFFYCKSLESITIPDNVTEIGSFAFTGCESLKKAYIPDGLTVIGDVAFFQCRSLTDITIPDGVTRIGDSAFCECESLTSINIPDSVTEIGNWAFGCCKSLKKLDIPDSVTDAGWCTFVACESLTEISVSENNKNYCSMDGVLFNKDKTILMQYPLANARSNYTVPDGVTIIEDRAFEYCDTLRSVMIPESVASIKEDAFFVCKNLAKVTIKNPECKINVFGSTICNGYEEVDSGDEDVYIMDTYFNGTIYGYTDSTAQTYAKSCVYNFKSITTVSGDVSGNGKVDLLDAIIISKYILNSKTISDSKNNTAYLNDIDTSIADFNNDGKVDLLDVISIAKYIIKN